MSSKKLIRIGTRESALALWQARKVMHLLNDAGFATELVLIKSEGDKDLVTPLYAMGVQGIFTKALDAALLSKQVDIAVHSLKDVPVQAAKGLCQIAVLERDSYKDVLVFKENLNFLEDNNSQAVIATSSIRRKAQWLNRYPHHHIENLRGNVNMRLQKLAESAWSGAIFAAAGLERIDIRPENSIDLGWMLPAPAQGAIAAYARIDDAWIKTACTTFNHEITALCTHIERSFLKTLMGGCSAPIAALAVFNNGKIHFNGCVLSVDGKIRLDIEKEAPLSKAVNLGMECSFELLKKGANKLISNCRA